MLRRRHLEACGALLGVLACVRADAAAPRTIAAERLHDGEHVVVDGTLDEDVWARATAASDFVQQEPREGEPARERTEVRLAFDEGNLYLAVVCRIDPARILATSLKRDFALSDSDTVGVVLDPFDDDRNGLLFEITPNGALHDEQVTNDGANQNVDWNAVWDARTTRTPDGWRAEIVIPFKSLRFPETPGHTWGVNFNRYVRGSNEMSLWSPVPRPHTIARVSSAGQLTGLDARESGRNLKFTPYALGRAIFADGTTDPDLQAGADLKFGLSTSTTLDLTLNTDFSEIEVDARQVNLTRFPLFYPEKRPFFLENADLFHFGVRPNEKGGGSTGEEYIGFFSRRIGLAADGTPLPLWGGARLTGRTGPYAFGVLQVSTREKGANPTTHYTVARGKRNILGHSDVGVVAMSRQAGADDHSRIVGADLNLQFGKVNVTSFLSKSFNPREHGRTHASKILGSYADRRFEAIATWIEIGDGYDRSMSYIPRRDVRMFRGAFDYHYRPRWRWIRDLNPHVTQRYILDSESLLRTKKQHIGLWIYFHDGSRFELYEQKEFERLDRPFQIAKGIVVPTRDYAFDSWVANMVFNPTRVLSGSINVQWGQFWNGTLDSVDSKLAVRVRPSFVLEGRYERNQVKLLQGAFNTDLVSLRVQHAFNTRQFLDLLVQYDSQEQVFSYQGRYNLIHRPLSDLFVVLSEERRDEVGSRVRSLAIKFNRLLDF